MIQIIKPALAAFLLTWVPTVWAQTSERVGQSEAQADCSDVPLFSISAFAPASADLPSSSLHVLDLVAQRLAGRDCIVTVTGYGSIGFDGTQRESFQIALARAQSTVDALVDRGVAASNLLPETLGAVTDFGTPSGNRRVTVAFTPERGYRCSLLDQNPAPPLSVTVSSFGAGSAKLEQGALLDIETFVTFEDRPECHLVVQSYTSVEGSDTENDALSIARAEAIRQAMAKGGISPERVSLMPMGETEAFGEDLSSNRRAILGYR